MFKSLLLHSLYITEKLYLEENFITRFERLFVLIISYYFYLSSTFLNFFTAYTTAPNDNKYYSL